MGEVLLIIIDGVCYGRDYADHAGWNLLDESSRVAKANWKLDQTASLLLDKFAVESGSFHDLLLLTESNCERLEH